MTWMRFCPKLAIWDSICDLAPLPMLTMAMTAPTPMMMPSMVRSVRRVLRRKARTAIRKVARIIISLDGQFDRFVFGVELAHLFDGIQALADGLVFDDPAVAHHDHALGVA